MAYETHLMLCLSTAHLSDRTCNDYLSRQTDLCILQEPGASWTPPSIIAFEKGAYGWFVHVPEEEHDWSQHPDVPLELRSAMHVARSQGCGWIMFDRDGPTVEDLPTYDW